MIVSKAGAALLGLSLAVSVVSGCSTSSKPHSAQARRYLAIADPANKILDESFDALEDHDDDVSASVVLLRTIATTERGFDRDLLALTLPAPMGAVAAELVRVNELRADLTSQAAAATSVASLQRSEVDLDAMNVPVETQVAALRKDLGLPPPDTE